MRRLASLLLGVLLVAVCVSSVYAYDCTEWTLDGEAGTRCEAHTVCNWNPMKDDKQDGFYYKRECTDDWGNSWVETRIVWVDNGNCC